jgi:DNA polymerase V
MNRGGSRQGAGRPKHYKTPTKPVRIPIDEIAAVMQFIKDKDFFKLPFFSSSVAAGVPQPADEHVGEYLNLNDLIKHPSKTFLVKVSGQSMQDAGINANDILIVDSSVAPVHGKIVVAAVQNQLTVKRIHQENDKLFLVPANAEFSPIEITDNDDLHIWGVVVKVIHDL